MRTLLLALLGLCGVFVVGIVVASVLHPVGPNPNPGPTTQQEEKYTPPPADMNPPKLPAPETYGEATDWMQKNKIYGASISVPNRCSFLSQIDASTASVSELQSHIEELTACLMKVWQEPVTKTGFVLPRPPATVYTTPLNTACGKLDEINASYCGADQRIYYSAKLYRIVPGDLQHARFLMDLILAHEFGHTIQARTGISISEMAWEQKVSKSEANVYSRRLEQQADCLAGMFTQAVGPAHGLSGQDLAKLATVIYDIGDDVLSGNPSIDSGHGSGKNRQSWFTKGLTGSTSVGQCNTFTAPASTVR